MKARKLIILLGLVTSLGLLGGFGISAANAQSAPQRSNVHGLVTASAMRRLGPEVTEATDYVTLFNYSGKSYPYQCTQGNTYGGGLLPSQVKYINNDFCGTRVWIHEYNNNTGVSKCASPGTTKITGTNVIFVNVYISNNGSACPSNT